MPAISFEALRLGAINILFTQFNKELNRKKEYNYIYFLLFFLFNFIFIFYDKFYIVYSCRVDNYYFPVILRI